MLRSDQSSVEPPEDNETGNNPPSKEKNSSPKESGNGRDSIERKSENETSCNLSGTRADPLSKLSERGSSKSETSFGSIDHETSPPGLNKKESDFTFHADTQTDEFKEKANTAERAAVYGCEQFDKSLKGMPSNMKDIYAGAAGACKMVETRVEMINKNNATPGYDKYFHCMGNCRAAEFGGLDGAAAALVIDTAKELKDVGTYGLSESKADFKANLKGLEGGLTGQRCHDVCNNYKPARYR